MIKKLAIPNRGEIAVRIIRAAKEMGISTLLLHSDADRGSLAWREADERKCLGGSRASDSYLHQEKIIRLAKDSGADAIHPGIGFLAEQASFAQLCFDSGLVYVGPSPQTISDIGNKISAKKIAHELNIPVIPGFALNGSDREIQDRVAVIGLPVIAKATSGGGGFGLKVIHSEQEFWASIAGSRREAQSAFGEAEVFVEKYFENVRHVEVQIFGDVDGHVYCLNERDCTVQRRNQKIIEEAPAEYLSQQLKDKLCAAAVRLAMQVNYLGAGTVEFLLCGEDFYFLEVNTRLQVEHPVTEMILGIDLVKAQLQVACGQKAFPLHFTKESRGHALECRIYAEDPYQGGIPVSGKISGLRWPELPHTRIETGYKQGDVIPAHYDSLIAKIIVWRQSREDVLAAMQEALAQTVVFGIKTNVEYLQAILKNEEFISDHFNTKILEKWNKCWPQTQTISSLETEMIEAASQQLGLQAQSGNRRVVHGFERQYTSPWIGYWRSV